MQKATRVATILAILAGGALCAARQDRKPDPMTPDPNGPRPIAAHDTLFIEEMTWMEVRDALKAGKDTVLVAAGGIEQNGPYVVTGKHNVVLRATTQAIAEKLGNALIAPILGFVPEGDFEPPTDHMKYPGTIGVSEETFRRLVADVCSSLRVHGFRHIILIGDHGPDQEGLEQVSTELSKKWAGGATRVHYIAEYYDDDVLAPWLEKQGLKQSDEGLHDDFIMEAQLMVVDPSTVRMKQRIAAGKFRINGVDLAPAEKTIEWGRKIVTYRADLSVAAIRKATGR
ncbi:MAG TPA: creatininase family protein [Planctomycetota bacterium]|jgi:creatinine amidohydrolase/Fe(II)-dependent formamide hydrolase-like protein|nr:creatininase family protein [Planctomycetota bacterium]